jgi:hypothetical protein
MKDVEVTEMWQLLAICLSRNVKQLKSISNKHVKTFGDINYKMMLVGERKQIKYIQNEKKFHSNSIVPLSKMSILI